MNDEHSSVSVCLSFYVAILVYVTESRHECEPQRTHTQHHICVWARCGESTAAKRANPPYLGEIRIQSVSQLVLGKSCTELEWEPQLGPFYFQLGPFFFNLGHFGGLGACSNTELEWDPQLGPFYSEGFKGGKTGSPKFKIIIGKHISIVLVYII